MEAWLKGKKTYIVMLIGVIVNAGVYLGYLDATHLGLINTVLGFLGLGAIRAGVGTK